MDTQPFQSRWDESQGTQPFVFSNGDVTGYSGHGDFMAGWEEDVLQHIIDTCNAGDSGMDQCPDLPYGLNSDDCTIPPLFNEKINGKLTVLHGNNCISGFSYGAAPRMSSGPSGYNSRSTNNASSGTSSSSFGAIASTSVTIKGDSAAVVGGYIYAGCYLDNSGRVLGGDFLPSLGPMTNEICIANCVRKGFSIAATEDGNQCYCGNDLIGSS